jgi:RNA-directed DNA polymerase
MDDQEIAAMLVTQVLIRTLQKKLYAKAKQEPGYRFYALYDKVYRADILHYAYRLVRSNKGKPGIDGVSFEAIEAAEGVEQLLAELAEEVKNRTYRPMPVRRVMTKGQDSRLDGCKPPEG